MEQRRRDLLRTALRGPDSFMQAAGELARRLQATPNDATARLAKDRIATRKRLRRVERLASQRREAVARVGVADAVSFPTPDELRAAMLSGRRGA